MINPPAPPKPPTPHREMLARTLPNGNLMGNGVNKPVIEEKKVEEDTLVTPLDTEHDSEDQKHRDKCTICQSKVKWGQLLYG